MTITHLSHYGLELLGVTADNAVLSGSLVDCKRMAASHGMEIDRIEGQIMSINGRDAIYAPANESSPALIYFKGGGIIMKGRDDYSLVIPVEKWKEIV